RLLLWLALTAGFLLDLFVENHSFGFNIGFYLLVVITSKLIMRAEDQSQRLLYCIFLSLSFSIVYFAIAAGTDLGSLGHIAPSALFARLATSLFYNLVATLAAFLLFNYLIGHRRQLHGSKRGWL